MFSQLGSDWTVAGREGNRFLLRKSNDGKVHDLDTDRVTEIRPLQVWFKWANWEPATDADYLAALEGGS